MSDRLIKIYVANFASPYLVPESTLSDVSDYFVKAIKNDGLGNGIHGTLRFPVDEPEAWKLLLYWMSKRTLPSLSYLKDAHLKQSRLVHLWILGDKYNIPHIQDLAMLELLRSVQGDVTSLDIVKFAFENTLPGSKLRLVMAEEGVQAIELGGNRYDRLEMFDGVPGFSAELMRAMARHSDSILFSGGDRVEMNEWEECMVA